MLLAIFRNPAAWRLMPARMSPPCGLPLVLTIFVSLCMAPLSVLAQEQEEAPAASASKTPASKPPAPKPKPSKPKPASSAAKAPASPKTEGKEAPSAVAPTNGAAPATADPSKTPQHVLQGNWIVFWYGENKATPMNIAQASGNNGITTFMGGIATLQNEVCALVGTVLDDAKAQYADGPTTKSLAIAAYVMMRAQCAKSQIWIEAFGLPDGKVLMSGRAMIVSSDGQRSYAPVAFGRQK